MLNLSVTTATILVRNDLWLSKVKIPDMTFWFRFTNVIYRLTDRMDALVIVVMIQKTGSADPSPKLWLTTCG